MSEVTSRKKTATKGKTVKVRGMDSKCTKLKAPKASPFKENEIRLLLQKVDARKHIIENKESDGVTWDGKEAAYTEIAKEMTSYGYTRTPKQLRDKWNNLKKNARSEFAREKASVGGTGGGPGGKPVSQISEEVVRIVGDLSIIGGQNSADCDFHGSLFVADDCSTDLLTGASGATGEWANCVIEVVDMQRSQAVSMESNRNVLGDENVDPAVEENLDNVNEVEEPSTSLPNWAKYTPTMLRTPRSSVLNPKNSTVKKDSVSASNKPPKYKNNQKIYATHERVINAKAELITLQKRYFSTLIDHAENEEERKKQEHKFRIECLRKEHTLRIKKLAGT